jgi:hypothetical protein
MTPEREAALRAWFDGTADDLPYTGPHLEATRRGRRVNPDDAWQDECRDLLAHVDHLRTWPGLMETVRSHFPEDVFDGSSGDPGPLLVVALREIDRLKGEHNADLACLVATRDAVISAGDRDLAAAIVAARVKGDAVVAALDAERKAHAETRVGVIEIVKVARDEIEAWTSGMAAEKARADALEARLASAEAAFAEMEIERDQARADRREEEHLCKVAEQNAEEAEAKLAALVSVAEEIDGAQIGVLEDAEGEARAQATAALRGLAACLSDLSAAATAYRDRVRAEAFEEAATIADGHEPAAIDAWRLREMASEKGGAK